jgi:hypothetical protein
MLQRMIEDKTLQPFYNVDLLKFKGVTIIPAKLRAVLPLSSKIRRYT